MVSRLGLCMLVAGLAVLPVSAGPEARNLLANGSFEFWSHLGAERLAEQVKNGPVFDGEDPLIPTRWIWRMGKPMGFKCSGDAHSGQGALAVSSPTGGGGFLSMGRLEVVPGARYSFGAWAKGAGNITVQVVGEAPEGEQELGNTAGKAAAEWTNIGGTLEIPGHIRLVWLRMHFGSPCAITVDDAYISAPLEQEYDADDVLTRKPERDANTLLLLDFEKDEPALKFEGNVKYSGPDGGRFGRGLRMESGWYSKTVDQSQLKQGMVTAPFKLPAMPEEGTLEFWLSPDAMPNMNPATSETHSMYLQVRGPSNEIFTLMAGSDASVSASWRIDGDTYGKKNYLPTNSETSSLRMRKGEWHHLAVSWDRSAWRFYVDGVLNGITTKPPLNWWDAPVAVTMGSEYKHLGWNGVIDEVRLSKVRRYGPFTPKGATPRALPVPEPTIAAEPTAVPAPKVDFKEARLKLLSPIALSQSGVYESTPDANGDLIYEATSAKPLVEGLNFKIEQDSIVKGLATATVERFRILGLPNIGGMYWKLKGIKAGKYWVGLLHQCGEGAGVPEAAQDTIGNFDIYLNGRQVQCSTMSDPIQAAPGAWFAEVHSAAKEGLKDGDEIAVVGNFGRRVRAVRLMLRTKAPAPSAHRWRVNPGPNAFNQDTSLGVSAETTFVAAQGKQIYPFYPDVYYGPEQWVDSADGLLRNAEGKAVARCFLANPLPVPVEVDYECVVRGYYLQVAGRDAERLTLAPHAYVTRDVPFDAAPDVPSYFMTTTLKAVSRPDLGWPAYDEFAFFPGYRHLVPWTDPFNYRFHRRLGIKQVLRGERQRLALHGQWEGAFTRDLRPAVPPPADLRFAPVTVPPQWGRFANYNDPKSNAVYLRRTFTLPEWDAGRAGQVIVDSVSSEGTVYINGQNVGNIRGYNTPLVCDATKALRRGENEILIVIRNKIAITNKEYVTSDNPTESTQYMDAPGDCNSSLCIAGGVWVETMPAVSARDIRVDTSVRKGTVSTQFTVVNGGTDSAKVKVKASVEDAGKTLFTLGERELSLNPGESKDLGLSRGWEDPRLWTWEQPNLYVMTIEICDAASHKRLDLARERFGFKESWIQGDQILYNGHPVRLKGVGCAPSFSMRCPVQLGRGAWCPEFNDETGGLVTELVTGLTNTPSKYNVSSDAFWATTTSNALVAVKRKWNHPSIIAWDLSNEWFTYAPYTGADMALAAKRFKGVSDAVEKLDPSRWTFFNGDYDLNGAHNTLAAHYMLEAARPDPRTGFGFDGHSVYFPDGAFLHPLDKDPVPGDEIMIDSHQKRVFKLGSKPLMDTENLWKVGGYMLPGSAKFVDEEGVLSPVVDSCGGPFLWMWKQNFDGHRDLSMGIHSNHEETVGTVTRCHMIQTFIMPDVVHHGFAGRKLVRRYAVLNDLFRPARMSLKWQLVGPDMKVVTQGADERKMKPAETSRGSLSFMLPKVTQRSWYTLRVRLYSDGAFVCGEDRDIDVWPDVPVPVGTLSRRIVLFDPKGVTSAALRDAGAAFESAAALAPPAGDAAASALVVGEGALDENSARQIAALGKYVADGGRLLILAQTVQPQGLPVRTTFEGREWSSQPYVRYSDHPLLNGVTSWDLHFWAPDRVTARGAYTKPEGGAAVALVDSGTETGLEWVQVMEVYHGNGLYLLCQLQLAANGGDEPLARELLSRALRYVGGRDAMLSPVKKLRLIAARNGMVEAKLLDLGVAYEMLGADASLDTARPTLLEGGIVPAEAQRAAWKTSLADGATLVVAGARPEDAGWLGELAGAPVRITVPRYRMWEGRGCRSAFDPLTAGLSHLDLFWKEYLWNASIVENPDKAIEQLQDASAEVQGGRELIFPGALVEAKVGKGRLIIDERRWATTNDKLLRLAARNLSALALGLGVGITPPPPPRELPPDVLYRPLDITPYANRALADDVAEDGKGGWSDQGPDADLRSFPTGDRSFRGVPFKVGAGAKSIIVLKSNSRPPNSDTPDEATIPVGYPVEGLCFLHGSAYTGGRAAVYQIQYADGTRSDIPLTANENIRDWADKNPGEFANERGTKSYVAWTGSCKMFSPISLYLMRWVNPRPEKPVKAVRFATADGSAVPVLIGLTAAVKKDVKDAAQELAKAQELLRQAQQAVAAQKTDDAKAALRQALALVPDFTAAHQTLADLCEKGGNEDETLDVYRQWTKSGARTPLPWNRLGEILEKRKDYQGALDAYTQSLKVEWNQPPAIEAKTRLTNKLLGK